MSSPSATLARYVPRRVLHHLASRSGPSSTAQSEHFLAAVLFADIVGFTALTEQLAQGGPAGVEAVSNVLNNYFGKLIDLTEEHGGEIVKFAGDGCIVLWPALEEPLERATCRAAQCALALQESLQQGQDETGVILSLRVGLGAGEIITMYVGGCYGRWEILVAGAPLVQMRVIQLAQPGEVIVSPDAWHLLQAQAEGTPPSADGQAAGCMRLVSVRAPLSLSPLPALAPTDEIAASLREYISRAILHRLDASQQGWLAELRRLTVLFLSVIGLDYSAGTALAQVQAAIQALQTVLYHYEGSVNQLLVDDKGTILVAAFGLPPRAHEDDAARAVQAALAIQASLSGLGLQSAIGLATGLVFCGERGNAQRSEYAIIGDTVNLAARLMQTASPERSCLCDAETYNAVYERFHFAPLPPITLKGKQAPVALYHPLGPRSTPPHRRPQRKSDIVGRTAERARLREQLNQLRERWKRISPGSPSEEVSLLLIEGEAGIGKSKLVADLLHAAQEQGVHSFIGAGDAIERIKPYHGWQSLFSQLLRVEALPENAAAYENHLLAYLAAHPEFLVWLPLLNVVLPIALPENDPIIALTEQARASRTRDLLARLLLASATERPTLIVLDDAHWLDSASWSLVLALSQAKPSHPLLLVIVTRPLVPPYPPEYNRLLQYPALQIVSLATMPAEEILSLLCYRLGVRQLPEAVAALIQEKAQGNPFYSEELTYALRESGLLQIEDGQGRLAPEAPALSSLGLPDSVQGIILSRIDRLPPAQQLTLKVASVVGRVFAYRTLETIHPIPADRPYLTDYLQTLEQLDLTPLDTPEPDLSYIFKHIITQEVAYGLLLFAQRRQLHQAVAEWYEQTYPLAGSPLYALLAHHWHQAQLWEKSYRYSMLAGDGATRLYAYVEARQHYAHALEALEYLPDSAETQRRYAETTASYVRVAFAAINPEHNLERLLEAERRLRTLSDAAPLPDEDRLRLARLHYWIGRLYYYRLEIPRAVGYFSEVVKVGRDLNNEELFVVPAATLGRATALQGHFGEAKRLLEEAVEPLERAGVWSEWFGTVGTIGLILIEQAQYEQGLAQMQRMLARALALNNATASAAAYWFLTYTYLKVGELPLALEASQKGLILVEQSGDRLYRSFILGVRGWTESRAGQHEAARQSMSQSRESAAALGGTLLFSDLLAAAYAEIALNAGDAQEALRRAEDAVELARTAGGIAAEAIAHRVWARALAAAASPRWEEIQAHLEEALRLHAIGDSVLEAGHTRLAAAHLGHQQGDNEAARRHLAEATAYFERMGLPSLLAQLDPLREVLAQAAS
ncbi:MAG: AAA family ATPase [Ardenticatenales bacterium]|nr:AAA family ATPase [Ardenticatenales bacterium]